MVTQKLQSVYECSTYKMNALLLEIFLFWFTARCGLCLASYSLKHVSQSLSDMPFLLISSVTPKLQGTCNSTTHHMTALLPRMLSFMLKVAKQLQPSSYGPVQTSLSSYFVYKYE